MAYVLGIICYGWHEAAAVLVQDGQVIAAAEEERFSRQKFDSQFPAQAIAFCLRQGGLQAKDLAAIGYGFDPRRKPVHKALHILKFLPKSLHLLTSRGGMLHKMSGIEAEVRHKLGFAGPIYRLNHHLCHAASTFFSSPFDQAAILTLDGAGDWESCWWGAGHGSQLHEQGTLDWPLSLGHIYTSFTEYLGFLAFSDEYKVMGLAPYGQPAYLKEMEKVFWPTSRGFAVDYSYFNFPTGHFPRYGAKLVQLLGPPVTDPEQIAASERFRNIAASVQAQLEIVIRHLTRLVVQQTGQKKLCLAGGVGMNCVANGKLLSEGIVDQVFVPPCASDCGVALGAAWIAHLKATGSLNRQPLPTALLGPEYPADAIELALRAKGLKIERLTAPATRAAELLAQGQVLGWYQGRMEFGQRALGCRSILADPRKAEMKETINRKVKFREPFRPFAPSVLEERVGDFFQCQHPVPFMTEVYAVRPEKAAVLPAVTHADGTARIQTVSKTVNPLYWDLIRQFGERTGVPVLLNTSFNVKGQPIVNTPEEAADTFLRTDLDALVAGPFLATKT